MSKQSPKTLFLGIGPYENPGLASPATHQSRILFFHIIDGFRPDEDNPIAFRSQPSVRLCEDVLPSFAVSVWNHFANTALLDIPLDSLKSDSDFYRHLRAKLAIGDVREFIPNQSALREHSPQAYQLLTIWAEDWNLHNSENDWCLEFAIEALRHWLFDPGARECKFWYRAFKSKHISDMWDTLDFQSKRFSFKWKKVSFTWAGWNPRLESSEDWRRGVVGHFEDALSLLKVEGRRVPSGIKGRFSTKQREYLSRVKRSLKNQGLKATPRKRDCAHLLWMVQFQVGGLALAEVCRLYDKPFKTVSDGINRTLDLIGLTKRRIPAGRKIGTRRARQLSQEEKRRKTARLQRFLEAYDEVGNPENKADVARAIGVSPQHFRRVWVPYLKEETGYDYNKLIRRETIGQVRATLTNGAYPHQKSAKMPAQYAELVM